MSSARWVSPLRYPGGKGRMAASLADLFEAQFGTMDIEVWAEPFAGGAGAGLHLLDRGVIAEFWMTEKNPALAAFWRTVASNSAELAARVLACEPDMDAWHAARAVVGAAENGAVSEDLDLALAALIVNRCSRSGMVQTSGVGPIGGKNQTGADHLRSRWNSEGLADRITAIGRLGGRIRVAEGDAIASIAELDGSVGIEEELFVFVDPPYLGQGNRLYAVGMSADDHKALAVALTECAARWLLTYDCDDHILELYPDHRIFAYPIPHSANQFRIEEEYAVLSHNLSVRDDQNLLPVGDSRWVQRGPETCAKVEPIPESCLVQ